MGNILESLELLKTKMSKIAEATRSLAGTTKKLSLDEIPEVILKNTGTFCYYLGEGTSFNVKDYFPTKYKSFTEDNFVVGAKGLSASGGGGCPYRNDISMSVSGGGNISYTYDSSTGDLKITGISASASVNHGGASASFKVTGYYAYIVSSVRSNNCYYLGTGASFDVSNITGYQNLTADNFIVAVSGGHAYGSTHGTSASTSTTITKSYDSSTGKLTIKGYYVSSDADTDDTEDGSFYHVNMTINTQVYLVIGEIITV